MNLKNKKILITGGCGFIGSNIARVLVQNNDIKIIDNLVSGSLENIADIKHRVNYVNKDLRKDILTEFKDIDLVFHVAANVFINISIEDPIYDANVNILGTLNVLEACRKFDIKKLVFSSSSSVYGNPQSQPISETHVLNPKTPYAIGKRTCEMYCEIYYELYGLKTVSLRYFNVYGPYQRFDNPYSGVIAVFVNNALTHKPLIIYGDGKQTRDFVNVKDVVNANITAASINKLNCEKINIGTGNRISITQLAKSISELVGNTELIYKPARVGDIYESVADITRAKTILNYTPTVKLKDGLNELIMFERNRLEV